MNTSLFRNLAISWLFLGSVMTTACKDKVKDDDTLRFFDQSIIHEVKITVSAADFAKLIPGADERVPCTFTYDGVTKEQVGIRLKGGFGSLQDITQKPGFSIKTNEFIPGQEVLDMRRFTLDNSIQDPSFLSAHIGHEIFRAAGVTTSRTAYTRVTLNGEYFGVYLAVESYNDDFLARNFADNTGNLYEGAGDPINLEDLDLDSNQDINDRSDLEALREVLVGASNEQLLGALSEVVDLDAFFTYWAVEALTYHWDGYAVTGGTLPFPLECCSPNNYNLYHEPSLDKLYFMPHGIDNLFIDVNVDVLDGPSVNSSLPTRIFATQEGQARLVEKIRLALDVAWDIPTLEALADDSIKLIRASVEEGDRNPNFNLGNFEQDIQNKKSFLNQRPAIVEAQLTAAGF
jgi:spore coat protein H